MPFPEPEDPKADWWANQIAIWFFALWLAVLVAKIWNQFMV